MHELSIAQHIGEIVKNEAKERNALAISGILVEVGELAGVELEALQFAWDSILSDQLLKGVSLTINTIPGRAICIQCKQEFDMHDFFELCPVCNGFETDVIQGKEIRIKEIEIEY